MMIRSIQNQQQLILAGMYFLLVFTLDYLTPLHVAGGIGILYIAGVLFSMNKSRKTILYTAVFATSLIVLNYIYFSIVSQPAQQSGIPFNRILSVIGLWVAVIVALKSKKVDDQLLSQRAEYTETIEEIVYINSHKVRNPAGNIVKLIELMEDDHLSTEQTKQMMTYLRKSALELEKATREMTDTISGKKYNQELLLSSSI